jgi:uncharacterized protein (DUF488 family)
MRFYTLGYGGRAPSDFLALLEGRGVRTVVDVRLRPDRASLGSYAMAKTKDKGFQRWLADRGVNYVSLVELGNVFMEQVDWQDRYARLLERAGDLLLERLLAIPPPFCLVCAEKRVAECHRRLIADYLVRRGWEVEHIE